MNILYIGDIMGAPGVRVVERLLPELRQKYEVSTVIAQSENVTDGRGVSLQDYEHLRAVGIKFFTGGNWSLHQKELHVVLNDDDEPIIRPANYPEDTPGKGFKFLDTPDGKILVVSLLGHIVGKDADRPTNNPLATIDKILEETKHVKCAAIIVNFHGDYSSEKRVIGYYLDGRVTAVIGDHWHVPTADAMVLPKGTAHITDVGMCGTLHSSLGVKLDIVEKRWRDNQINRNELETDGPLQLNAVLITTSVNGLAADIKPIHIVLKA